MNQLFINNEFIASKSTDTMDVINPATREKIDTITFATEAEVNDAVEKSKQAQLEWEKHQSLHALIMLNCSFHY